jgi:polyisoprenoid-binding protein YceI
VHLRSADFLDVETYPTMTFRSTGVRPRDAGTVLVDGELTLRGVTGSVTLQVEVGGFTDGQRGRAVAGFCATTEIDRTDFGVTGGTAGSVVGHIIRIALQIEATPSA